MSINADATAFWDAIIVAMDMIMDHNLEEIEQARRGRPSFVIQDFLSMSASISFVKGS